jgi:hypothetical protein
VVVIDLGVGKELGNSWIAVDKNPIAQDAEIGVRRFRLAHIKMVAFSTPILDQLTGWMQILGAAI